MDLRVLIGLVHIVHARSDDDAGGVMLGLAALPGSTVKSGNSDKRDIHTERAGAGLVARDALVEIRGQIRRTSTIRR